MIGQKSPFRGLSSHCSSDFLPHVRVDDVEHIDRRHILAEHPLVDDVSNVSLRSERIVIAVLVVEELDVAESLHSREGHVELAMREDGSTQHDARLKN